MLEVLVLMFYNARSRHLPVKALFDSLASQILFLLSNRVASLDRKTGECVAGERFFSFASVLFTAGLFNVSRCFVDSCYVSTVY